MAEPGAPKGRQQGGKPASSVAPRGLSEAPPGARALPVTSPKAPLAPRVRMPAPSIQPANDFHQALARLEQQRESGAPAPEPPVTPRAPEWPGRAPPASPRARETPVPRSGLTEPLRPVAAEPPGPPPGRPATPSFSSAPQAGSLDLKPGTHPLAPSRIPTPLAIVGGGSLRLHVHSPAAPSAAPLDAPAVSAPPSPPMRPALLGAPPAPPPVPYPDPAATIEDLAPAAMSSSRPALAPPSAPAAGGPAAQYERAFRQWSIPPDALPDAVVGEPAGAVTFQVYTAKDIGSGRGPVRSIPAIPIAPPKMSLAARIGLSILGALVVLATAAAVILVSTEDPRPPAPALAAPIPPSPEPAPTIDPSPPPPATMISIGDPPVDDAVEVLPADTTPAPSASAPAPSAPAPSAAVAKPTPKVQAPAAPASLRAIAPPPNPYGD